MDQPGTTNGEELLNSEHDVVSQCSHCVDRRTFDPHGLLPLGDRYKSFHQPCLELTCSRFEAPKSVLCDPCRHLRLWHLIICMGSENHKSFEMVMVPEKSFAVGECPFCRMIGISMLSMGYDPSRLEYPTTFHLEICEVLEADEMIATISTVSPFDNGNAISLRIIGELHIDIRPGSTFRPHVGEMVSWNRVRKLTRACLAQHDQCRYPHHFGLPEKFRVIDVAKRCLTEKSNCDFVALSYVWGQEVNQSMVTSKNSIEELKVPGSLSPDKLPQTLEDAMRVCEQLQERYLWIDRLCIIQDDIDDKAQQIKEMDKIFSAARFVIVTAYGDGVNFGIPGVSRSRWATQTSVDLPGISVTNLVHQNKLDDMAVWQTRAWTYQEAVLVRRSLYFTNTGMYMECERGIYYEDEFNSTTMLTHLSYEKPNWPKQLKRSSHASSFDAYIDHVKNYSSRFLSFQSDVYAAFAGILTSLFGSDSTHYGMPLANFDCALHWFLAQSDEDVLSLETHGTPDFPSWSWYSQWSLPSWIDHESRGFCGTLSVWYSLKVASNTLLALNEQCESLLERNWQFYMAIAYEGGCVKGSSSVQYVHETEPEIVEGHREYWLDYSNFYQEIRESFVDVPPEIRHIMQKTPSAILGHLQSTFFNLDADLRQQNLRISDSQGETVGYLWGCYPDIVSRWESQNSSIARANRQFEFVGTMLRVRAWSVDDPSDNWMNKTYFQGSQETLECPVPLVMVMLITWNGSVARRKATGWVYLKDWIAASRTWKTIILQ